MCYTFWDDPLIFPFDRVPTADPRFDLSQISLLFGKALTKSSDGLHRGRGGFAYPINELVRDPGVVIGGHDRCLHFANPRPVARGELNEYGSHRLLLLPSKMLWSSANGGGRCYHDGAALPIGCLDCGDLDFDVMDESTGVSGLTLPPDTYELIRRPDVRQYLWQRSFLVPAR